MPSVIRKLNMVDSSNSSSSSSSSNNNNSDEVPKEGHPVAVAVAAACRPKDRKGLMRWRKAKKRARSGSTSQQQRDSISDNTYIVDPSADPSSKFSLQSHPQDATSSTTVPTTTTTTTTTTTQTNSRSETGCMKVPTHSESLSSKYCKGSHQKNVRWGEIEIRSHDIELGDNPSCRGAPIAPKWNHYDAVSVTVDQYEDTRPPYRHKNQLVIPSTIREDMLRNAGYSRGEMKQIADQSSLIQMYRTRNSKMTTKEHLSALMSRLSSKQLKSISINVAKKCDNDTTSTTSKGKQQQQLVKQ